MLTKRNWLFGIAFAGLSLGGVANASVWTWTGSGANDNWNTAGNWSPVTVPTNFSSTYLEFGGTTRLTNVNNISGSTMVGGFVFLSGAGSFTLNGTAVGVYASASGTPTGISGPYNLQGVNQLSSSPQTINIPITIRSNVLLTGDGTGVVTLTSVGATSNDVTKNGTSTYFIDDADGTNFGVTRTLNVNAGKLFYRNTTNSATGGAGVSVLSGATFGGDGQITPGDATTKNRDVTIALDGILSPGTPVANSVGTMRLNLVNATNTLASAISTTTSDLSLVSGSKFIFDLATPSTSDQIRLDAGVLRLNSQQFSDFTFNALPGFGNGTYTLIDSVGGTATGGSLNTTPANLTGTIDGRTATLSLSDGDVILTVIPEPATLGLASMGAVLFFARRRRA